MLIDHFGSGGAQRQIVYVAKGLKRMGYDVEFAIYYPEYRHFRLEVELFDIPINEIRKSNRFDLSAIKQLVALIKKNKVSHIVSFLDTPNVYAELVSWLTDARVVVSERSTFPDINRIGIKRSLQCSLHRFADVVVANSLSHSAALKTKFPFLRKKVKTIYNVVDEKFFEISGRRQVVDCRKILCVGTINHNKNPIILIRAIHYIRESYKITLKVSWAGKKGHTERDKSYFRQCEDLISALKLHNQWQWLGECEDISKLHLDHGLLVHASYFEGLSNAICEGMASGMVVIASNVFENPYLLGEISKKLLFDPDNFVELADSILSVISLSEENRIELSRAIAKRGVSLFNESSIIGQFSDAIFCGRK